MLHIEDAALKHLAGPDFNNYMMVGDPKTGQSRPWYALQGGRNLKMGGGMSVSVPFIRTLHVDERTSSLICTLPRHTQALETEIIPEAEPFAADKILSIKVGDVVR
jgi:hypothetical protein